MESLGVLAGGVAHDLNNILGPLVAYPELIRMKLPADSPTTVHISKIEKSAQRAAEVVQDLLTMARRGRYEMCPIKLNKIVDDYLQSPNFFDLRMRFPLVSIETELADSDCFVYGSEPHLYKVIMNLVINALDAMPHGGKLKIRTECQYVEKLIGGYDNIEKGRFAILTVSDTGIGIDKKDYKRIFEPFYTKKEMGRSGSGLGLAIVYGVIKDHNGYIDIQSELDKGSYFVVYLPIMENAAALQDTSILNIHGSESILIVDDVAEQRELAATVLASLGYKVDACANGHEAAEYLKRGPVDVVILDMIMEPGFDGLDTYRKIIELRPGQKAIITSGFSETGRVREAEKLGVGKYVRKPYTMQQLGRAIREVLAK
jgi:CheY-like chemotaxis protein